MRWRCRRLPLIPNPFARWGDVLPRQAEFSTDALVTKSWIHRALIAAGRMLPGRGSGQNRKFFRLVTLGLRAVLVRQLPTIV